MGKVKKHCKFLNFLGYLFWVFAVENRCIIFNQKFSRLLSTEINTESTENQGGKVENLIFRNMYHFIDLVFVTVVFFHFFFYCGTGRNNRCVISV